MGEEEGVQVRSRGNALVTGELYELGVGPEVDHPGHIQRGLRGLTRTIHTSR